MSDNSPPEFVQQQLDYYLRIPTELWTDIFKMLSRRVLVQRIAPVCYRFKEISNKNVKSVHVIRKAHRFTDKLKWHVPEAKKQLAHLAVSKCKLAGQFKLTQFCIVDENKAIVRHCPDLFQGCQIEFSPSFDSNNQSKIKAFMEYLDIFESTMPATIRFEQLIDPMDNFLLHPTVQKCRRVMLNIWAALSMGDLKSTYMAIFEWLHHRPIEMDYNDGVAAVDGDQQQVVRCMIFGHDAFEIDWLLERCSHNIHQSQEPIDRRPFVLSFECWDSEWSGFDQFRRIENKLTGEVLVLDRVMDEPVNSYRLRRCLAEEEARGEEFYAGMFNRDWGDEEFNVVEEATEVEIGQ